MGKLFIPGLLTPIFVIIAGLGTMQMAAADTAANERAAKEARELADKIRGVTNSGAKPPSTETANGGTNVLPKGDPCVMLRDTEVRKVFPKAANAKPERSREKYGITACTGNHPSGTLVVQVTKAKPRTVTAEARGLVAGFVSPLKQGAARAVRLEMIPGVGDEAVAVVERKDDKVGILADAAYVITQRGDRQVTIIAADLALGDRAVAVKTLEELGRMAVGRL